MKDGRCDKPILENEKFNIGKYEIRILLWRIF